MAREVGLYIHVPFCRSRCHFCAFYLQMYREDRASAYIASLLRELTLYVERNPFGGRPLTSVYFGGGTPTTLRPDYLSDILTRIRSTFPVRQDAEITLEAHPDTVTTEGLGLLVRTGFNRISFGIQSMEEHELLRVGRRSLLGTAKRAVANARQAGFANINLDLIYGLPGQTLESWLATLRETLSLLPTHVSCYALTIEEGTRLNVDRHRGEVVEPDEELQNRMEDTAQVVLENAGYVRYELSNYARPGFACRHNLLYWTDGEYLGLGPSAQSYLNGCRFGNVEDLGAYHRLIEAGRVPVETVERLSPRQRAREAIVFGLRLIEGIDQDLLRRDADRQHLARTIERLIGEDMLESRAEKIRLTERGRRVADSIAVELL
ncbi:MAG: coproporphyrinogen III oxidase [Nitrospiraceae bacterium]|nr:MAG: coproporphyrinogen III oxidase [Nitrospiraceae bacterium]